MSLIDTGSVFRLPDLGEGLTEAAVLHWLVEPGSEVAIDQPIVEVETAKAIVELPSPYAGTVLALHCGEGETLAVGAPLMSVTAAGADPAAAAYRHEEQGGSADVGDGASGNVLIGYGTTESPAAGRRRRRRGPSATPTSVPEAGRTADAPAASPRQEPRTPAVASPVVRRLARDGGLRLADIEPTGAEGVVTRSDVVRALAARESDVAAPTAVGERRTPLSGFRKAMAAQLSRSRAEIPEATVWVDVDATALWQLRESTRTATDPGPGILAYLARFVVAGLRQYPVLNASLDLERQEIVEYPHVHLGIAVQGERGLVVPAVADADHLSTDQLDSAIKEVTERARAGRCTPDELSRATFTLNNYGGFRVDGSAAIINHPQVAILGFGRILDRPWVVDGEIVVRKLTQMSFVFDHRVCDGGTAAGFMRLVADAIENPLAAIRRL